MCISYVTNYTVIYKDQGRILHGLQTTDTSILTGIKAQRSHRTITVSLLGLVTALAMEQLQQQLEKTWHGWLFSAFPLSCSTSAAMATQEAHFLLDRREFWKPSSSPRCWLHLGCSSSWANLQDEHFQGTERERETSTTFIVHLKKSLKCTSITCLLYQVRENSQGIRLLIVAHKRCHPQ